MQLDSSIDLTSLRSERLAYVEEGKACKEEYNKIDNNNIRIFTTAPENLYVNIVPLSTKN